MRLIDADEILRHIERDFHKVYDSVGEHTAKKILFIFYKGYIKMIDMTPTTYDVDKVIERLEDEKNHCSIGCYEDYDDCEQGKYDAYCRAIKIVKEGGIDEQIHRSRKSYRPSV